MAFSIRLCIVCARALASILDEPGDLKLVDYCFYYFLVKVSCIIDKDESKKTFIKYLLYIKYLIKSVTSLITTFMILR